MSVYPNEGDWPNGLSLIPWFAQTRAMYLLLSFHQRSTELDTALGLLFLVGFVCATVTVAVDQDFELVMRYYYQAMGTQKGVSTQDYTAWNSLLEQSLNPNSVENAEAERSLIQNEPDGGRNNNADLVSEHDLATRSDAPASFALVMRSISHQYHTAHSKPADNVFALRDLSLALKYGETFGYFFFCLRKNFLR
jgi:hypothetical protein